MGTNIQIDLDKAVQVYTWLSSLAKVKGLDFVKGVYNLQDEEVRVFQEVMKAEPPLEEDFSPAEYLVLFVLRERPLDNKAIANLIFFEEEEVDKICESLTVKGFIK